MPEAPRGAESGPSRDTDGATKSRPGERVLGFDLTMPGAVSGEAGGCPSGVSAQDKTVVVGARGQIEEAHLCCSGGASAHSGGPRAPGGATVARHGSQRELADDGFHAKT